MDIRAHIPRKLAAGALITRMHIGIVYFTRCSIPTRTCCVERLLGVNVSTVSSYLPPFSCHIRGNSRPGATQPSVFCGSITFVMTRAGAIPIATTTRESQLQRSKYSTCTTHLAFSYLYLCSTLESLGVITTKSITSLTLHSCPSVGLDHNLRAISATRVRGTES